MILKRGVQQLNSRGVTVEFLVGEEFTVLWSNGGGQSTYRIVDNPGSGRHLLEVVQEVEYPGHHTDYPPGTLAHDPGNIYELPILLNKEPKAE
jgi:hypothetical protein